MTTNRKKRALNDLAKAHAAFKEYERGLALAVQIARDQEASWADIGEVLGTTRQAAQQRFGPRIEGYADPTMTRHVHGAK